MPFPSSPALDRYAKTRSESRLTDFDPMEKRVDRRRFAMKSRASFSLFTAFVVLLFFFFIRLHCEHTKIDTQWPPHTSTNIDSQWQPLTSTNNPDYNQLEFSGSLPRGIVESTSDMELKPLWENPRLKGSSETYTALLAIPVGIKQKQNVDIVVRKFLSENCSVILFHYDGNVDGWRDLEWSDKAIHIVAINQTKWWFAKRFLHPDVVDIYDYIFLWDEDLGVENFHAGRYLRIMISEGLEISQPALDPRRSEIHHRITVRNRTGKVHRRVYAFHGSLNCSDDSRGPPCTGWVEGMAPVFSRAAWRCVWHLIQNDLIHGWGLDMKLGYCAQGDRTKKVGVIDSEFIIHQGIPSLGGSSANKPSRRASRHGSRRASRRASRRGSSEHAAVKAQNDRSIDSRSHVRRQSTVELEMFQQRWDRAVRKDEDWIDPFKHMKRKRAAT